MPEKREMFIGVISYNTILLLRLPYVQPMSPPPGRGHTGESAGLLLQCRPASLYRVQGPRLSSKGRTQFQWNTDHEHTISHRPKWPHSLLSRGNHLEKEATGFQIHHIRVLYTNDNVVNPGVRVTYLEVLFKSVYLGLDKTIYLCHLPTPF